MIIWQRPDDVCAWLTFASDEAESAAANGVYDNNPGEMVGDLLTYQREPRLCADDDAGLRDLLAARFEGTFTAADVAPMLRALADGVKS